MTRSRILTAATRVLMPLLILYSFFLVWRGHNAPGGGFVGGLVAAAAFVLYSLTAGVAAGRQALRVAPSTLLSVGLGIALVSGLPGALVEGTFMRALWGEVAGAAIGTPLLFDVGVYLAVMGVVLTIVFALSEATLPES